MERLRLHGVVRRVEWLFLYTRWCALAGGLRDQASRRCEISRRRHHGVRHSRRPWHNGLSDRSRRFLSLADCGHGALLPRRDGPDDNNLAQAYNTLLAKHGSLRYLSDMSITVRFAPSPTGQIHIGNTRTALFNWLFARQNKGRFVLRFDETDQERSRAEYADQIEQDLAWLGIKPDLVLRQSDRVALYEKAVEKLTEAGLLSPCYETSEELERRRKIRLSRRLPPVYGREALKLTDEERQALEAEGRKPHWRFLLPN